MGAPIGDRKHGLVDVVAVGAIVGHAGAFVAGEDCDFLAVAGFDVRARESG